MSSMEDYTADTEDGYRLVLQRVIGGEKGPVIMCHGLAGNSNEYLQRDERCSLARYLASNGYDAWVVDLRGHGLSKGFFIEESGEWDFSQSANGYWDFNVDDLIRYDTKAIIDKVKEVSGSDKVSWIGRSMGGWLGYAHVIDGYGKEDFKVVVSIASPSHFSEGFVRRMGDSRLVRRMMSARSRGGISPNSITSVMGSMGSSSKGLSLFSNESRYVFLDFLDFLKRGEITKHNYGAEGNIEHYGSDISPSYWENFDKVDVPMVFITGTKDRFATPESTTESYNKVMEVHGESSVHILPDFGHIDILVGDRAYVEVFPLVLEALDSYDESK
ncbi:MAG: alpha/beta fold hydrolase [Halobacteriota archaeon]|nr:alpha/beta fold hydrolase [Halobacteriota archaeon]